MRVRIVVVDVVDVVDAAVAVSNVAAPVARAVVYLDIVVPVIYRTH